MNAIQVAAQSSPKTIGELKQYISDMESKWTKEDEHYLGKFDDQQLYIATDKGIRWAFICYRAEFGFITFIQE